MRDSLGGIRRLQIAMTDSDRWASLHRILAREVPEVAAGAVELRAVARAPGHRTKLAVTSLVPDLDPIGACVGRKGRRAQAIVGALGGERIDILPWSDFPEQFVKLALAPARVRVVELDLNHHLAVAHVDPDQVQLAHGKDDVNLLLAIELTGWDIEIVATDAA